MKIANEILLRVKVLMSQNVQVQGKASYALSKNIRKINRELEAYEEYRNSLVAKYGDKGEDNNYTISPSSDKWTDFVIELTPVANECVEVDIYYMSDEDFDNIFCETWTPADYDLLYQVVVQKQEK